MTAKPPFVFIGKHVALDFVNTELIEQDRRLELLGSEADFLHWASCAGLASARVSSVKPRLDPRVHGLRAALRSLFEAQVVHARPADDALATLNRWLERPRRPEPLLFRAGVYRRGSPAMASTAELLAHIADQAAELLLSERRTQLKSCANGHCILLFLDQSRAGRRRWCSMEVCGNRAKVAAHQRRHRP